MSGVVTKSCGIRDPLYCRNSNIFEGCGCMHKLAVGFLKVLGAVQHVLRLMLPFWSHGCCRRACEVKV